jgi:hypothetical protein
VRLVIHQPHLLPWLGYFNKLAHADAFVALDDVNYRKGYFHNRALLLGNNLHARWLTLPVQHGPSQQTLAAASYCAATCRAKAIGFVDHVYRKHRYFGQVWAPLRSTILTPTSSVSDMNIALLQQVLKMLDLSVPIVKASILVPRAERTERLIRIARALGSSELIFGEGGASRCHDVEAIGRAGIRIVHQKFIAHHPTYEQPGVQNFVSNLSVVDALMAIGPERTRDSIRTSWEPAL